MTGIYVVRVYAAEGGLLKEGQNGGAAEGDSPQEGLDGGGDGDGDSFVPEFDLVGVDEPLCRQ
jgi:hypothetical protein